MQAIAGLQARKYDGASVGRRTDGWIATSADANTELAAALTRLRGRARDLVRNNPYAARAVKAHTANTIGSGIVPRSRSQADEL
jgi:capsid protein